MGSVLTMVASIGGGAENAEAQLDVPMNTTLIGVKWSAYLAGLDADDEFFQGQLSFGSSFISSNDSRSIVDTIQVSNSLVTSGMANPAVNQHTPLPDLPLMGGERLYLNFNSSAGITGAIFCHLHIEGDMDKNSVRRR